MANAHLIVHVRVQVDRILAQISSNSLFAPNIDQLMSSAGQVESLGGAEFASWVKQNFTKDSDSVRAALLHMNITLLTY